MISVENASNVSVRCANKQALQYGHEAADPVIAKCGTVVACKVIEDTDVLNVVDAKNVQ
jgi:hypothetical protein